MGKHIKNIKDFVKKNPMVVVNGVVCAVITGIAFTAGYKRGHANVIDQLTKCLKWVDMDSNVVKMGFSFQL